MKIILFYPEQNNRRMQKPKKYIRKSESLSILFGKQMKKSKCVCPWYLIIKPTWCHINSCCKLKCRSVGDNIRIYIICTIISFRWNLIVLKAMDKSIMCSSHLRNLAGKAKSVLWLWKNSCTSMVIYNYNRADCPVSTLQEAGEHKD